LILAVGVNFLRKLPDGRPSAYLPSLDDKSISFP
jgi:hypothetical protein